MVRERKTRCVYCRDEANYANGGRFIDGKWYCKYHVQKCDKCGECHPIASLVYDESNERVCNKCLELNYKICKHCEKIRDKDKFKTHLGEEYCCSCFGNKFAICSDCGKISERYKGDEYLYTDTKVLCPTCFLMNYSKCDFCGRTEKKGSIVNGRCLLCSTIDIFEYSTKPTPRFISTPHEKNEKNNLFFGFELEVMDKGYRVMRDDQAKYVNSLGDIYCKYDGTVKDGFEIVSQPFTWDSWKHGFNTKMKYLTRKLTKDGWRSYDTNCCGMHVHINKNAFTGLQIYKLMKLIYDNRPFTYAISQRKNERELDEWANCHKRTNRSYIYTGYNKGRDSNYDRRQAVNLTNSKTLEIRIFKGTLNYNSFSKNIEFCKAIYEFSGLCTAINDVLPINFVSYVVMNKNRFPNLFNFLIKKAYITGMEKLKVEEIGEVCV
jgi:hypothetical protein